MSFRFKQHSVLPGFGLSLGFSLLYTSLLVLIPLAGLVIFSSKLGWEGFWSAAVTDPRVLASYRVTFSASLISALINLVFGFIVAWVLVRYTFPGKRLVDAIVDLPFALPTALSGIALVTLYAHTGWVGRWLPEDVRIAYAYPGIVIALTLIGLPFVVRTVQPALEEVESELEEAAVSLGATRLQTFTRVILPTVLPALLTGFALSFARAIGEYGSVVFIAGNMPMKTEIAPLMIITKLEQYEYQQAAAIGVAMLIVSFVLLLIINLLQAWSRRYQTA